MKRDTESFSLFNYIFYDEVSPLIDGRLFGSTGSRCSSSHVSFRLAHARRNLSFNPLKRGLITTIHWVLWGTPPGMGAHAVSGRAPLRCLLSCAHQKKGRYKLTWIPEGEKLVIATLGYPYTSRSVHDVYDRYPLYQPI